MQNHYFKKYCVYKGHTSDKIAMQKSFTFDQAFMNNAEKIIITIFKIC